MEEDTSSGNFVYCSSFALDSASSCIGSEITLRPSMPGTLNGERRREALGSNLHVLNPFVPWMVERGRFYIDQIGCVLFLESLACLQVRCMWCLAPARS